MAVKDSVTRARRGQPQLEVEAEVELEAKRVGSAVEAVADATDGDDQLGLVAILFEAGAEALDVDVEGLGVAHVVEAPDAVDQHLEQLEFLEREADRLAAHRDLVSFLVEADAGDLQHGAGGAGGGAVLVGTGATQEGPHPGDQLAEGEGLGDVVVGAHLQADHAVNLGVAGGQHQYRDCAGGPDAAADVPAALGRQHQVEHHQIGTLRLEVADGLGAVAGGHDLHALAGKRVADRVEQRFLVVNHQDLWHVPPRSTHTSPLARQSKQYASTASSRPARAGAPLARLARKVHLAFASWPSCHPQGVRRPRRTIGTGNRTENPQAGARQEATCAPPSSNASTAWRRSCCRWARWSSRSSTAPWRRSPPST